jgi:hypothetical protein
MRIRHTRSSFLHASKPSAVVSALVALSGLSLAATAADAAPDPLVNKVREATERYIDINVARADGFVVGTPCVSGPDSGAMGVHLVLPRRLDGVVNVAEPEALIYEPLPNGAMRLVGVEYIAIASAWASLHADGSTPALEGNLMNYVAAPNRFGLPAFYEIHVWAWEHNPRGTLADWNTQVSCDSQPAA